MAEYRIPVSANYSFSKYNDKLKQELIDMARPLIDKGISVAIIKTTDCIRKAREHKKRLREVMTKQIVALYREAGTDETYIYTVKGSYREVVKKYADIDVVKGHILWESVNTEK